MYRSKNRTLFNILIIAMSLYGCALYGRSAKELTIDDIAGSWENIQFGYLHLYIDKSGKGYIIPGIDSDLDEDDIYKIDSISFSGGSAIIAFSNIDESEEQLRVECTLFGEGLLVFKSVDDNDEDESVIFMREVNVDELRKKVKAFLKKEGFSI